MAFPLRRTCFTCINWRGVDLEQSGSQSYCVIYREFIDTEAHVARDCPTYEHCAEGEQDLAGEDLLERLDQ